MADPKGSNWSQAQDFAKKGKFGRAKQQVELGGGTWSKDMHKSLKATGDFNITPEAPPETSAPDLQQSVDDLVAKMQQQQAEQQASYQQQQSQYAEQQRIAAAEQERMKPKDASQALYSTILSGGESWGKQRKKQSNWLKPFSAMKPGGISGIG